MREFGEQTMTRKIGEIYLAIQADAELSKEDILNGGLTGQAWRWAVKQGIIFGYENNSLRPENPVTRAEYAAIITRFVKHYDLQFE